MSLDGFWAVVDQQVEELKTAKSADDVLRILSNERNPYGPDTSSGDGFFAGSGGDSSVAGALEEAGWSRIWYEAHYYYAMRAPDGQSAITYVEGDIFRGNRKPLPSNEED